MSSESLSPDEWAEMSEAEREAYRKEQKERLEGAIHEDAAELEAEEQDALEAIAAGAEDATETHTVELTGGEEVEVIDTLPGRLEEKAAKARSDNVDAGVESTIDVMTHLIQTEGFDSPEVWRLTYQQFGMGALMENALKVTEPYYQRQKHLQNERETVGN